MLKVYVTDIAGFWNPLCYEEGLRQLDAQRRNRILAYKNQEDRLRGLAAGLLLKEAVNGEGLSPKQGAVTEKEGEKPRLASENYFFNLSHAGNFAVCAFADCEVGVDLEMYARFAKDREKNQRIAKRIMTLQEWDYWKEEESEKELLKIWTRKESYAKLTGKGLGCDFSQIDTRHGKFFQEKEISGAAHLSVCTQKQQPKLTLRFFEKMI